MMISTMDEHETKEFVQQYYKCGTDSRFEQMLQECKRSVIQSIVVPFGLSRIIATYDKTGGNVDTIHNVRKGVYATDNERQKYENKEQYNSGDYHKDQQYIDINRSAGEQIKNGKVYDYLTREKILRRDSVDLDHIVSAKEIHNDPGRVLAETDGKTLANMESNLAFTDKSINRSKQDKPMVDFLAKRDERVAEIKRLEEKRGYLTQQEMKELEKLKRQLEIDDKEALKRDKEARDSINTAINKAYYTSSKFMEQVTITSAKEGVKMGGQQALGLIVVEFFTALFDEIEDSYHKGFYIETGFFESLSKRIKNIKQRLQEYIATKYKEIVLTFGTGFLSGILSNLTTTMINIFMTTSARLVRVIREGVFSFFRAIKLILFPPNNISRKEAWHEAKKLIVSGIIVGVGVFVEQAIESFLTSIGVGAFTNVFTSIFVGALTGVAIAMAMYWLDTNQKSIEQMRYEAISKLVSQNLPLLIQKRKELEAIIQATHKERLYNLQGFFDSYKTAYMQGDDEKIYDALNGISNLYGKTLNIKNMGDVRAILDKPNRTGKLRW
ncbi:magnesium transporter [Helicobacter trogontum]|uniref:Lactate permease n=1 Tax=Helicobacter trogontum TaxID=50960 RepID=A0A4U8TGK7_9HELI|nr:magnesium transporter [Helicobacter trogontum]MDY5185486.1 magnesium transporter [Helicobacter trogontum]TLD99321.1 lactate permease [Helicobacter trogontum]